MPNKTPKEFLFQSSKDADLTKNPKFIWKTKKISMD